MVRPAVDNARKSLERVQSFDTADLPRTEELGAALNFSAAVEPADKVIRLFRQIHLQFLDEFPDSHLERIRAQADSFYNTLESILKFSPQEANAYASRNSLIQTLANSYTQHFDVLEPEIAYSASRLTDFSELERDARAAVQRVADEAKGITEQLDNSQKEAQRILDDVRRVAAEQGVSQQAIYFKEESDAHEKQAHKWQWMTIWLAVGLGVYAILSVGIHKIPFLAPTSAYEAFQLGLSKILVFAVIAYMLFLSARNFLSHKHNAIVNKHRQNALLTFSALVDAATTDEHRDVVLTYAASCIFSPQDTGYTKPSGAHPEVPTNIINALPKLAQGGGH